MESSSPKWIVDHRDLIAAANSIAAAVPSGQTVPALVGGLALQVIGSPRLTGDLGFVGSRPPSLPLLGTLSFGGEKSVTPSGVPVDFIERSDDYKRLYDDAADNTVAVDGLRVPVVAPPFLIAMKMAAGRTKDVADLEWLIVNRPRDIDGAREIVRKHLGVYALKELDALVQETLWKNERGML